MTQTNFLNSSNINLRDFNIDKLIVGF